MSLHRTKATFIGLLEAGRANEWVVTEKLGDSVNNKNKSNVTKAIRKSRFKFGERSVLFSKKTILSSFWRYNFNFSITLLSVSVSHSSTFVSSLEALIYTLALWRGQVLDVVCVWVEGCKRKFEANVHLQKYHHPCFYFQLTFIHWICIEPRTLHFQLKFKHTHTRCSLLKSVATKKRHNIYKRQPCQTIYIKIANMILKELYLKWAIEFHLQWRNLQIQSDKRQAK